MLHVSSLDLQLSCWGLSPPANSVAFRLAASSAEISRIAQAVNGESSRSLMESSLQTSRN
jgi:hypothetical protein